MPGEVSCLASPVPRHKEGTRNAMNAISSKRLDAHIDCTVKKGIAFRLACLGACYLATHIEIVVAQPLPLVEEVTVTATLMEEVMPSISVSVLNGRDRAQRGGVHLDDLVTLLANVSSSSGASRSRFIQIRGIGERSQFIEPLNPSIGILLDGVDLSGLGGTLTLFDLEQVEVLRGPQGTLMGANALAGVIAMQSTSPEQRGTAFSAGAETDGGYRLGMKIGGPTSENTSARLALQRYTSDGFTNNQWLNRNDTNARDELTARGAARWQSNGHLFETALYYTRVNNGYDAFSLDNTRDTLSDEPGEDDLTLKAARIKWQGPLGPYQGWLQLSHADTETTYSYDEDWSFVGIAPGWEYQSFDEYRRDRTMTSLEWRIQPLSGERTAWILGTLLRHQRETLTRDYSYLPGPFSSKIETDTGAVFAEVNRAFTDTLSGFIGARLEKRESHYRDSAAVNTPFDHAYWTGRTGLTWTYQRGQQTYLTLSRGARAGGANASLLASIEALPDLDQNRVSGLSIFDEETLVSLEWGWQGFWPGINLQSRLAIFAMERDDQQVRGSVVIPRNDGSTAFIDYTDNAAAGHHRGLEWEARWQPTEGWHWQLNLGVLDAQFDEYVSATGENLSGREQPQSPSWQYSLGARWDIHPLAAVQLELAGSDRYFFSDRHEVANDEIHQLNASISGGRGRWQWTLWGRNLTDRDTYTRGFGTFGNDPRKQYTVEPYRQYGEPRVVGVTIRYELFEGHQ